MRKLVLRIRCDTCNFVGPINSVAHGNRQKNVQFKIVRDSLERASMRILARRYKKTKKVIMKIIHTVTAQLPDSVAIAKQFCPLWSGILVFDGKVVRVFDDATRRMNLAQLSEDEIKWMHKMRWLCGVDYGTGDLPHYALADSENMIDLVIYFQMLKLMKYPLIALVCDGNPLIPRAAKFVFGKQIIVQRCTRHFLEDLRRLLPTDDLQKEERMKLEQLILKIKYVIEADTIEEAGEQLTVLKKYTEQYKSPVSRKMIRLFQKTKVELTAHLIHPELKLPHTSNDIENIFKQLMLRLKTVGRFFHQDYAKNYLNAWALLRRFTPFTDCRGNRRHRNKKTPLQLTGCEIENINPLKLMK